MDGIETALAQGDTFVAREISQRLGTLRFYWSGKLRASSRPLIADAVSRAEARSHCTCEECGELGRLYRSKGVIMTRCIMHARGGLVAIEPGFENAHLVQRVVDGHAKVVACRYDRATDAFIEIGMASHAKDQMFGRCPGSLTSGCEIAWFKCTSRRRSLQTCRRLNYGCAGGHLHKCRAAPLPER
jgi:hypothetical protein